MSAHEEWRPVVGYEGYYEVSNLGRVRSVRSGKVMRPSFPNGYASYGTSVNGVTGRIRAHRAVAEAFIGPSPDGKPFVLHGPAGKSDNSVGNLRWGSPSENMHDMKRDGTDPQRNRTHCPQGHPYDEEHTYVTDAGWRLCRTCNAARWRARNPPTQELTSPRKPCPNCGKDYSAPNLAQHIKRMHGPREGS